MSRVMMSEPATACTRAHEALGQLLPSPTPPSQALKAPKPLTPIPPSAFAAVLLFYPYYSLSQEHLTIPEHASLFHQPPSHPSHCLIPPPPTQFHSQSLLLALTFQSPLALDPPFVDRSLSRIFVQGEPKRSGYDHHLALVAANCAYPRYPPPCGSP